MNNAKLIAYASMTAMATAVVTSFYPLVVIGVLTPVLFAAMDTNN